MAVPQTALAASGAGMAAGRADSTGKRPWVRKKKNPQEENSKGQKDAEVAPSAPLETPPAAGMSPEGPAA